VVARAQQPALPVIGFIHTRSADSYAEGLTLFRQGLSETGYVKGQNVAVEYRFAENQIDRLVIASTTEFKSSRTAGAN
jgi:putative tryptophan/tyrosine transport system substrate-binding protein